MAKQRRRDDAKADPEDISFTIDLDNLEIEWQQQPDLAHHWYSELAKAKKATVAFDQQLDVIRAEIAKKVRAKPTKYDLPEKPTVDAIKDAVLLTDEYQNALDDLNKAKYKVDLIQAGCRAVENKKSGLENAVYLHGQGYFSSPRLKGSSREEGDELDRKAAARKGAFKRNKEDNDEED